MTTLPLKPKVLLVGATGFLGGKILRQLAADGRVATRALSRRGAPAGATGAVEWVKGDMLDPTSLDAALQGVDVVVTSANGYMKETIEADFQGNKNLIEAAARAGVKRFVFLSIVACEKADGVPHFHAKAVAEDQIRASGLPYVFIRAPAFLDQADDYVAKAVKGGKFYAVGDRTTRWSYVLTDDLAECLAKAAAYPDAAINNHSIDVGWRDGPIGQQELADLIGRLVGKPLKLWTVPWFVLGAMVGPLKLFSALGYDLVTMMLFFRKGSFIADTGLQERFFGPVPTAREAVARWARAAGLMP